jgi:hypothetical protein
MSPNSGADRRVEDIVRGVLAAFNDAARGGKSLPECYLAAVDAWHRHFPRRSRSEAAQQAVALVLGASYPEMAGSPIAAAADER